MAVLLVIDSPGGELTSMDRILKAILASDVPVIAWVAPEGARAGSAATFITLAADVAAMAEVVAPPEGGVLVPPDDAEALAAAALAFVDDPARRAAVSASARASARRFSWDTVAEDHLRFLEQIAAEHAAA